MSKEEKTVILPSEEDGWEVWISRNGVVTHEKTLEGAVTKADGQQDDCVAFSICRVATLPLLVPSTDAELYRGAAQLDLENACLLIDVDNYQGWDCVLVEKQGEQAFVSAIYLLEEELNEKNDLRQYSFDYSARFYRPSVDGDVIAIWRERHRWCMACYRNGIPFLTEPLGRELAGLSTLLGLTLAQLSLKGVDFQPAEVLCWSKCDQLDSIAEQVMSQGLVFSEQSRPVPSFPAGVINLQPSVVSEWRKQVASLLRIKVVGIAIAAIYLIVGAVFAWKLINLDRQANRLEEEVVFYEPSWEANSEHFQAWDELSPLVTDQWPLELYKECVMAIPGGQPIRFTNVNVQNGFVQLRGNALGNEYLNRYKPKLKNALAFEDFEWKLPPGVRDPKTQLWKFTYEARPVGYQEY